MTSKWAIGWGLSTNQFMNFPKPPKKSLEWREVKFSISSQMVGPTRISAGWKKTDATSKQRGDQVRETASTGDSSILNTVPWMRGCWSRSCLVSNRAVGPRNRTHGSGPHWLRSPKKPEYHLIAKSRNLLWTGSVGIRYHSIFDG